MLTCACASQPACSTAASRHAQTTSKLSPSAASSLSCSTAGRLASACRDSHQAWSLQQAACSLVACRRTRMTAFSSTRETSRSVGWASDQHAAGMGDAVRTGLNIVNWGSASMTAAPAARAATSRAARSRAGRLRALAAGAGAAAGATAESGMSTRAGTEGDMGEVTSATAGVTTRGAQGAPGTSAEPSSTAELRERTASLNPGVTCSACGGEGTLPCKGCGGSGRLGRAGYNKKNTLNMSRILNSKWTAMQQTLGWRHFRVMQLRKGAGGLVFLHMQASCDPTAQIWVNSQILRDRSHWAAGWLQLSEIQDAEAAKEATGSPCQRCSALGRVPCPRCKSSGAALIDI